MFFVLLHKEPRKPDVSVLSQCVISSTTLYARLVLSAIFPAESNVRSERLWWAVRRPAFEVFRVQSPRRACLSEASPRSADAALDFVEMFASELTARPRQTNSVACLYRSPTALVRSAGLE